MNDGTVVHTVERSAGTLAYRRWGAATLESEMPALLLLHGFTGSSASWCDIAPVLAANRPVYAFDLPGHGLTDLGTGRQPADMSLFARALEDTLVSLEIDAFDLLGYSLGGRTALYFAITTSLKPRRLILESACPGLPDEESRRRRREHDEELARMACDDGIDAFVKHWEQMPILAAPACGPSRPAQVTNRLRTSRLACRPDGLAMSLRGMGTGAQPWLGDRLADADCPSLLIAGEADEKFTRIARDMSTALPNARVEIVANAGHSVHLDAPTNYASLIKSFLTTPNEGRSIAPKTDRATNG